MGTLQLQNHVFFVKKVPKRTPSKIITLRNGAPKVVLRSIWISVSVFSHGGDRVGGEVWDGIMAQGDFCGRFS